jgi:hypothetical protein
MQDTLDEANPVFGKLARAEIGARAHSFADPASIPSDTPPLPIPSPPPIQEPPDDPEDPHVPVREPDPAEPSQI